MISASRILVFMGCHRLIDQTHLAGTSFASRWVRRRREPFSLGVGTIDETTNSPEHFLREKLDRLELQQQQFSIEDPPVPDGMPTSFGKQFWQILVDQVTSLHQLML
jgi:hypothetical protein